MSRAPAGSDPPPPSEQRPVARNKRVVLLALPSPALSQLVGSCLAGVDVEVVQVVDDEALERYLFARHRTAPEVVVWHVALASLAALDATWRAYREGRGPRLVLVRELSAGRAPDSQRSPDSGPIPGRLIYVRPEASAIVDAVLLLLSHAETLAQAEETRLRDEDESLREDEPLLASGG